MRLCDSKACNKMKTPESWRGYETAPERDRCQETWRLGKLNCCHRLSHIKHGRTDSQSTVGLKYSRSSSAGAARAWVAPAGPGFCVWAEPDPVRSGSTASPRASRPLRCPSPPWFFNRSCPSSSCRLPPLPVSTLSSEEAPPPAPVRHFPPLRVYTRRPASATKPRATLTTNWTYTAARDAAAPPSGSRVPLRYYQATRLMWCVGVRVGVGGHRCIEHCITSTFRCLTKEKRRARFKPSHLNSHSRVFENDTAVFVVA